MLECWFTVLCVSDQNFMLRWIKASHICCIQIQVLPENPTYFPLKDIMKLYLTCPLHANDSHAVLRQWTGVSRSHWNLLHCGSSTCVELIHLFSSGSVAAPKPKLTRSWKRFPYVSGYWLKFTAGSLLLRKARGCMDIFAAWRWWLDGGLF